MFKNKSLDDTRQKKIILRCMAISLFSMTQFATTCIRAQTSEPYSASANTQQSRQPATSALPEQLPEPNKPVRKIRRIGTAIPPPANAVSIKSTEAGAIRRPMPSPAGCINCGTVDFINPSLQGNQLNAIMNGVVAGTVAREVIRPGTSAHSPQNPHYPYQAGITLNDGRQAIIGLPDASNLQQGDRVRLIDGTLVIDREQ